jgi:hypothetical protein
VTRVKTFIRIIAEALQSSVIASVSASSKRQGLEECIVEDTYRIFAFNNVLLETIMVKKSS